MVYRYKDFVTGKLRFTRGRFVGWINLTIFEIPYAIFKRKWDNVLVPKYLLTKETLNKIEETQ
jgi:hypothetical protein